jgi:RsiW-degrading membrane proteinase PrsW (M82 family)
MPRDPHSVLDEPTFNDLPRAKDAVEHEVWNEPALAPGTCPPDVAQTYSGLLREKWRQASPGISWLTVAGLALAAGPFAVLAAFMKTSAPCFAVAAIIMAPLVEELGKAAAPLMTLERWPYRFISGTQLVLVCVASGLVFATIENLLYLHLYVKEPGVAFAAWRWGVCTTLHVGCSLIAGLGLRRVWRSARASLTRPDISKAASYFIAAMVLHGTYNALVYLLSKTHLLTFDK